MHISSICAEVSALVPYTLFLLHGSVCLSMLDLSCACNAEIDMEFYFQNTTLQDATMAVPIGGVMSKRRVQWLASWLDFASIMLFLLATVFIVLYQQHVLIEVASRTVTVVDYSLQVWDLPPVSCATC